MYKNLFMSVVFMATCISSNAQTTAKDYKGNDNSNPISANVFCADPTALEYNGRLYVYGTNDHQQFIKNGKKNGNGYGDIKSLVIFSTDDMVNWTFHGTIDVAKVCSKWGGNFFRSWAPSVTWRHNKETGKDEFFLYFANWAVNVGVLTADSPIGPWKSPLSNAIVTGNSPGVNPCVWCFDPGVVIDENGTGWLSFGGGAPNDKGTELMPNNAGLVKLKSDMIHIDGSAIKLPAPYHLEASELNIIGGKFVYTYCSSWADRNDAEWNAYKNEHGINVDKPNTCTMCYMVSEDPMNPDSWVYKGVYGPHPGFPSPNNHSHLHKFQGTYYHIYHWGPLMKNMIDAGVIDSSCDGYRSICVNKATVNENMATVSTVTQDLTGVAQIKNVNPYELQQMETMASCGGVGYEDMTNIKKNTTISTLGNDASENMQVKMKAASWINVRKVDFGTTGADRFVLRAKGTGKLDVRTSTNRHSTLATIEFSSTDWEDHVVEIPADKLTKFKNVRDNLYFVVAEGENVYIDSWKFLEIGSTGIQEMSNSKSSNSQIYDLSGRRLSGARQHRGIVIEQYIDKNGVKQSRKVLSNKE